MWIKVCWKTLANYNTRKSVIAMLTINLIIYFASLTLLISWRRGTRRYSRNAQRATGVRGRWQLRKDPNCWSLGMVCRLQGASSAGDSH